MLGFRVWDSKLKKMIVSHLYLYDFCINYDGSFYYKKENTNIKKIEHLIPLQSVGQYDCHGKMIYEGDIVEIIGIYHVKFKLVRDCRTFWGASTEPCTCSVIGNIYENPDLLEKCNVRI